MRCSARAPQKPISRAPGASSRGTGSTIRAIAERTPRAAHSRHEARRHLRSRASSTRPLRVM